MDDLSNEPIQMNEPAPVSPPPSSGDETPGWLKRKEYTDPAEKKKDFWLGFGLWWGLNIVLTLCQWGLGMVLYSIPSSGETLAMVSSVMSIIFYALPWVINVGLIIYLAFVRGYMALGMLAGFGSVLALTICLSVIAAVACMVMLGSYSG